MTAVPDLTTPFRKRAHSLVSPLAERFDAAVWTKAHADLGATPEDERLYRGTLWIAEQARALYADRPPHVGELGAAGSVTLAIAVLNGEYRTMSANVRAAGASVAADGPVSVDYLANVRFENAHGQNMSIGDYVEAFVDALDAWLFDAGRAGSPTIKEPPDLAAMVEPMVHFYSMRHILKRLYDKALHLGHYVDEDGVWVAHDRSIASLHQAWSARAEAVFGSAPAQLMSVWGDLSNVQKREYGLARSVTEARRRGSGVVLKVKRMGYMAKRAPQQPLMRIGLEASYVSEFLDQSFPQEPELTPSMVEDAWWICSDTAKAISRGVADNALTARRLRDFAFAIERSALVEALAKSLRYPDHVAEKLVSFLTYGGSVGGKPSTTLPGWRGLWAAPLVPVPQTDLLLLPQAVFDHCAPLYRMEAWLERGGIGDQGSRHAEHGLEQRGTQFEQTYRTKLCEAASQNDTLMASCVAPDSIEKDDAAGGFPEQVDILFKLGRRLFAGEVKFLLTPADPHQWGRYYFKLSEAAKQARDKAAAVAAHRETAARALGLDPDEIRNLPVTPLVILSNGYGFSLEVDGCRVVDAMYLRDFLRSPNFSTGGAVLKGRLLSEEVTVVYSSERDAAERFDAIMARPGVLRRFLDRIEWDVVDYPPLGAGQLRVATPFRGDMTLLERVRRANLIPPGVR